MPVSYLLRRSTYASISETLSKHGKNNGYKTHAKLVKL